MMIDTGVELLEKLKSHNDDHSENLIFGGDWCGMSMQRNGEYCMHKMHRSYIYMVQRRDAVVVGVVVVVVVEGDSCVKEEGSVAAKLNRRGTMQ
jgi:hypothetical protein